MCQQQQPPEALSSGQVQSDRVIDSASWDVNSQTTSDQGYNPLFTNLYVDPDSKLEAMSILILTGPLHLVMICKKHSLVLRLTLLTVKFFNQRIREKESHP